MNHLYSSSIVVGILLDMCMGSRVFEGLWVNEAVMGAVICSIWDVCGLSCCLE